MLRYYDNTSLHQWDQFMELGKDVDDSVIEEKIKSQRPEQCAIVVYTVSLGSISIYAHTSSYKCLVDVTHAISSLQCLS